MESGREILLQILKNKEVKTMEQVEEFDKLLEQYRKFIDSEENTQDGE